MSELNGESKNVNLPENTGVKNLYENWFLDYASYVILERAVPYIYDGLKPVQRRILHSLKQMDDGRFHKVANVIGQTMQYHPHGDASIGDALVKIGQKNLMIDTQGNWGDVRTGDRAAAARYIEARLSKFALEVGFNSQTTEWKATYDGRKKEPVALPVKFPLLLAQGVEGIAVGLSTKILPHNFIELIQASIKHLQGKSFKLYPDFLTGGSIDVSNYNDGKKGGKVKIRAKIEKRDKKTLVIKDIPYGTTTVGLMDSIVKANDKGKIKIKKVIDNTAAQVEIIIDLASGVSPDLTMDALYAFTDCEVSVSPNACVVINNKPHFLAIKDILKFCAEQTRDLLKQELEIKKKALEEKWHFSSLEKIFIENRIYRDIEECTTWEAVIKAIDDGLKPHIKHLKRKVTEEDIVRLTEIKIKRISKYDSFKADELLTKIDAELKVVKHDLKHITEYTIAYYTRLLEKYGKDRERKTTISVFENIKVRRVAAINSRLYVNRKDGFIGSGLKKDEFVCECSDEDNIIIFRKDGVCMVSQLADKKYVGKDIIHVAVFKKGDDRTVYHMIYASPKAKRAYAKRFTVTSITRDKEYNLAKGDDKAKVMYFTVNPNGESEIVNIQLSPNCTARKKEFEFHFGEIDIKGRNAGGNIVTKYPIKKVTQLEVLGSTLGGRKIWFDPNVGRINTDERGKLLGSFDTGDLIVAFYKNGTFEITDFELSNRYKHDEVLFLQKLDTEQVYNVVHYIGEQKMYYLKRFQLNESYTTSKAYSFISESKGSKLIGVTANENATVTFTESKGKAKDKTSQTINAKEFIDIKGWKATGNKISYHKATSVKLIEGETEQNEKKVDSKKTKDKDTDQLQIGDQLEWDFEEDK